MKLEKKKDLVSRVLGVGKHRILFNKENLPEIKEAITRQDIRDLVSAKAIILKEPKGRKKIVRRKTRRRAGSIKKKVNSRKKEYMAITRKLRAHIKNLKLKQKISSENYLTLRKEIRARQHKSLSQLKERVKNLGEK